MARSDCASITVLSAWRHSGGRTVAGISGEQFALPEAIGMLRAIRRAGAQEFDLDSAADPEPGGNHYSRRPDYGAHQQQGSLTRTERLSLHSNRAKRDSWSN